jgi:ribosomal protein L23
MENIERVLDLWLTKFTHEDKVKVMKSLTGDAKSYGYPLLQQYINLIKPYSKVLGFEDNCPREADCAASGIVFFYGCFLCIIHFPNWGEYIDDILNYNILYMLVDHFIDDSKVFEKTKNIAIYQMKQLIIDPGCSDKLQLVDPILKTISNVYSKMLNKRPKIKSSISKLFSVEIESVTTQKRSDLNREEYYDLALRKGGYTMQVIQHIVGDTDVEITESLFHIGTIMQLIDDCIDVDSDKANNINTIATYDLLHYGNLDILWLDIIDRIGIIDSKFNIYKVIYSVFAVYLPDRIKDKYSSSITNKSNNYNLFDYSYGCDGSKMLVESVTDELLMSNILDNLKCT